MITQAQIEAAIKAEEGLKYRIQGFHYVSDSSYVIKDMMVKTELWRGPYSDKEAFEHRLKVERMRYILTAAANADE